ncbi:MAG: 50S ribosomal protein L9 [Magnetococcales bacterium]|nr:50S ribosomal protein L9 [Magnetococcales bacterium]
MEVILLEKVSRFGNLGDVVRVKDGYGRNFLIPSGKALPATRENIARFEAERAAFEERQKEVRAKAEEMAGRIAEVQFVLERPAGAADKLFGSVTNADIAAFLKEKGIEVARGLVELGSPIRTLGEHAGRIRLHPDVIVPFTVRVDRSVKA